MANIIIDYLSFSIKNDDEQELIGLAKAFHDRLDEFCSKNCTELTVYGGGHGFTKGYISFSGFRTYYGGANRVLYVQISGQGCLFLDRFYPLGLVGFLRDTEAYGASFRRIDLAADDFDGILTMENLKHCCDNCFLSGAIRAFNPVLEYSTTGAIRSGTFYFGSRQSDYFMRIYDKKAQTQSEEHSHWMRCELEIHDDAAQTVVDTIRAMEFDKLSDLYQKLCFGHVRFLESRESNVTRSLTADWWLTFLNGCSCGIRFSQSKEYKNVHTMFEHFSRQCLGQLEVIKKTFGLRYLLDRLSEFEESDRLSAAHKQMILEFNTDCCFPGAEPLEYTEEQYFIDMFKDKKDEGIRSIGSVPDRAAQAKQFGFDLEVL